MSAEKADFFAALVVLVIGILLLAGMFKDAHADVLESAMPDLEVTGVNYAPQDIWQRIFKGDPGMQVIGIFCQEQFDLWYRVIQANHGDIQAMHKYGMDNIGIGSAVGVNLFKW